MNWKKYLAVFLALCMLLSIAGCTDRKETPETSGETTIPQQTTQPTETTVPTESTQLQTPAQSKPLLYKVTDSKGNVAWLFGSIHVGAEYFYPLPSYVTAAYENADALAVEFDIVAFEEDLEAVQEMSGMMFYQDGTTIKDHIPEAVYQEAVKVLDENYMYIQLVDTMQPSAWCDLIDGIVYENIGVNYDLGIDKHLLDRAHEEGKKILDIESAVFQLAMLNGYSDPLQSVLLEESIAGYYDQEAVKASLEEMMLLWANGDERAFCDYLNEAPEFENQEESALYEEYNKAMRTDRNWNMADYVEDSLASGQEVFVCVGAAHVVGAGAMVELLRERGYTVILVQE